RHVIQIDYRSEQPSRQEAGDENVAVPRHKLELCAACQKLHDQCIALQRDLGLAEAWIDELAGERCERRGPARIGRFGKQLRCLLEIGFSVLLERTVWVSTHAMLWISESPSTIRRSRITS